MAKTVPTVWIEKQQVLGVDSGKHSVVLSSQDEENATGVSPSELVLLCPEACTSYDVVNILTKQRQRLTGLEVTVAREQDKDPPWTYRKMHVRYEVRGTGLREKDVEDAIELSETKTCSVAATLRGTVELTYDYTIIEDDWGQRGRCPTVERPGARRARRPPPALPRWLARPRAHLADAARASNEARPTRRSSAWNV